jgi:hypothetical protein
MRLASTLRPLLLLVGFANAAAAADFGAPALTVGFAGVSGGDTNDWQLSYGAGLELLRSGRLSATLEGLYVRDFFEFEPDSSLDDAAVYSDVFGLLATARYRLGGSPSGPYVLAGPGWLRSRASGRTSDQPGFEIGGGFLLPTRSRLHVRIEARYFGSLSGEGELPPAQRYSFWRYGVELGWSLGRPRAQP